MGQHINKWQSMHINFFRKRSDSLLLLFKKINMTINNLKICNCGNSSRPFAQFQTSCSNQPETHKNQWLILPFRYGQFTVVWFDNMTLQNTYLKWSKTLTFGVFLDKTNFPVCSASRVKENLSVKKFRSAKYINITINQYAVIKYLF